MKKREASILRSVGQARQSIACEDRRLMLILSSFVLLLSCMLYVFFYRTLAILISLFPLVPSIAGGIFAASFAVVFLVLTVFLILPLFVGWMAQARAMARDEEADVLLLFRSFQSKERYWLSVRYAVSLLLSILPVAIVVAGTYLLASYLFANQILAALIAALVILLELVVGMLLLFKGFGRLYVSALDERMPWRTARQKTRRLFEADRRAPLRYCAYFLPRVLLGLATLGIYLLADVLPIMALTYFCDCDAHAREAWKNDAIDTNLEDINNHE